MKRAKTLLILGAILVALLAAIFIEKAVKQHIDKINSVDEEAFTIAEDDVTKLVLAAGDKEVTLTHEDGTWTNNDDTDFPVDQDYVSDMVAHFESVHASFVIEDVTDYSQYGLDSPEATVTFTTADGEKVMTFGTFSTIDEKRYICVDGGNVYLIDEDLLEDVSADIEDYLDRDQVTDYSQLTELIVTGDSSIHAVYDPDGDYTYTDAYDYYSVDGDEHQPLSSDKIASYLSTLTSMDLSKYETYKATPDDLKEYGLDNPSLTVKVTGDIASEEDEDSKESQSQSIYLAHEKDADKAYLYFDGSSIVYTIDSETYDKIADASYKSLRPDEVVSIDWTKVDEITTTIDGDTTVIQVAYDKNDGNSYNIDDEDVDFVTAVTEIDGLNLTEVGKSYEKGTEELAFSILLNDEDQTVIKVALYQYDGDNCVVTVDGQVVGLCSRTSMSTLREEMTSAILNKGKNTEE